MDNEQVIDTANRAVDVADKATQVAGQAVDAAGKAVEAGGTVINDGIEAISTSEAFGEILNKLTNVAEYLTGKLVDVAPEALDAILNLIRFKGAFEIGMALMLLFAWLWTLCNYYGFFKTLDKAFWDSSTGEESHKVFRLFAQGFLLFLLSVITVFNVWGAFAFDNWLALLFPEGTLALRALEAAGLQLF